MAENGTFSRDSRSKGAGLLLSAPGRNRIKVRSTFAHLICPVGEINLASPVFGYYLSPSSVGLGPCRKTGRHPLTSKAVGNLQLDFHSWELPPPKRVFFIDGSILAASNSCPGQQL